MDSLVIELQRAALDKTRSCSDLLRTALVVARKLRLAEFEEWISRELGGYPDNVEYPAYRQIEGEVKAFNPFRGLIPVIFEDPVLGRHASRRHANQPIAEVEALLEHSGGRGSYEMPFRKDVERNLMNAMDFRSPPRVIIQASELVGIIDGVRNAVLNWALKLEDDGILGSGFMFTAREQSVATQAHYTVTNFYGDVSHSQIQQNSSHASQDLTHVDVDLGVAAQIAGQLRETLGSLALDKDAHAEVAAELATIEAQLASPRPKAAIIKEGFRSVARVLENGAGSAVGTGIVAAIAQLLN